MTAMKKARRMLNSSSLHGADDCAVRLLKSIVLDVLYNALGMLTADMSDYGVTHE
jgi:hypothetical protein